MQHNSRSEAHASKQSNPIDGVFLLCTRVKAVVNVDIVLQSHVSPPDSARSERQALLCLQISHELTCQD